MTCQNDDTVQVDRDQFPYDSGHDDGPVLLDSITIRKDSGAIVGIEPNPRGSFGMGWHDSK